MLRNCDLTASSPGRRTNKQTCRTINEGCYGYDTFVCSGINSCYGWLFESTALNLLLSRRIRYTRINTWTKSELDEVAARTVNKETGEWW